MFVFVFGVLVAAPTLGSIAAQATTVGFSTGSLALSPQHGTGALKLRAQSSNSTVVSALTDITLSSNSIDVKASSVGQAVITVTVEDQRGVSAQTSFHITSNRELPFLPLSVCQAITTCATFSCFAFRSAAVDSGDC